MPATETRKQGARTRKQGEQTRERILDVAAELFTKHGYEKTSLRDIAERLGITKAALYYHFERKEDILLELHLRLHAVGDEVLDELEALPDGPARVAAWPRLLDRLVEFMTENRELILLHTRNSAAMEALASSDRHQVANDALEQRLTRILGSPAIALRDRVRMAATIGVVTEVLGESGSAFSDVPTDELHALLRETMAELLRPRASASQQPDENRGGHRPYGAVDVEDVARRKESRAMARRERS
jgi:AcrR family transcriptional regulator